MHAHLTKFGASAVNFLGGDASFPSVEVFNGGTSGLY